MRGYSTSVNVAMKTWHDWGRNDSTRNRVNTVHISSRHVFSLGLFDWFIIRGVGRRRSKLS